jgi:ABC-type Mn2+/Zn2+ transport system ATPase subunit
MPPLIDIGDVDMGYGARAVLRGVHLEVGRGDFLGIVGPNGSGKTTLLRTLLGLLPPLRGEIRYAVGQTMGYVPQRRDLDPLFPLSVTDIVLMGLTAALGPWGWRRAAVRARALEALEMTGIADLAEASFRDLSGGQQQRTLIARALVSDPSILLLDEPTNDMDVVGNRDIMDLLGRLHAEQGRVILMVSHLLNVVANHCGRLAILHGGGLRVGSAEEILTDEVLTELYEVSVKVRTVEGQRVVLV